MKLVGELFSGPIDIVGDIHGEIGALEDLLSRLGYRPDGTHLELRRLVFVGDLVDRGPDSPAVVERVIEMAERGHAQCVLGNHELNLLLDDKKEDNHWFADPLDPEPYPAKSTTPEQKARFTEFFRALPLILEREDLRVVHACWNTEAVTKIKTAWSTASSVLEPYNQYKRTIEEGLRATEALSRHEQEKRDYAAHLRNRDWNNPVFLPAHAEVVETRQMGNPIRIATSGEEIVTTTPFWASGKWRMVKRQKWWESYEDAVPVVVGHYWRRFKQAQEFWMDKHGPDLFEGVAPHHWLGKRGNVYCVDFSVGERRRELETDAPSFEGKLSALRVPEWEVWHDDVAETWKLGLPGK